MNLIERIERGMTTADDAETPITVEITDAGADDEYITTGPDPAPWIEFKVMDSEGNEITDDLPGDDLDRIEDECFNALDNIGGEHD